MIMYKNIIFIVLLNVHIPHFTFGFDQRYCFIKQCRPKDHTLCKYSQGPIGKCSGQYSGLNNEMKIAILNRHNELRAKVARGEVKSQPSSSNMMEMKWNEEAEVIAQRWTNQCTDELSHDSCRYTLDGIRLGQNAVTNYVSLKDPVSKRRVEALTNAVDNCFDEVNYFPPDLVDNFKSLMNKEQIGHYTQLVWAKTTELGCGYVEARPTNHFHQRYIMHCNYKPNGNVLGTPVYKRGVPCSACPNGTRCSKTYPGLCTADDWDKDSAPKQITPLHYILFFIVTFQLFFI